MAGSWFGLESKEDMYSHALEENNQEHSGVGTTIHARLEMPHALLT